MSAKGRMQEAERNVRLFSNMRPQYTRPDEIQQYMELAKTQANLTQLPGQNIMNQNIQQSTQGTMSNVRELTESPTASLGALADINRMEIGAFNNLALQQAQYYQSSQDRLVNALQTGAQYSDQEWNMNVYAPWQSAMNWEMNKYEAAQEDRRQNKQNVANIAGSVIGAAGSLAGRFLGGGKQATSQPSQEQMQGVDMPNDVNLYKGRV